MSETSAYHPQQHPALL